MRSLASGKVVAQFSVATNAYIGQGKETAVAMRQAKRLREQMRSSP